MLEHIYTISAMFMFFGLDVVGAVFKVLPNFLLCASLRCILTLAL